MKAKYPYIETHLTDQCNLNCQGCIHFSNIAEKWFYPLEQFEHDVRILSNVFETDTFKMLGGEPLLNKNIIEYLIIALKYFPDTPRVIGTNGILLTKMPDKFWKACHDTKTGISVSVYPNTLTKEDLDEIRLLAKIHKVSVRLKENEPQFRAIMNWSGNSDKQKAYDLCNATIRCNFFKDGHIYTCAQASEIKYINKKFGMNIPENTGLKITEKLTGEDIVKYLSNPIETCKWCSDVEYRDFKWSKSDVISITDWNFKEKE